MIPNKDYKFRDDLIKTATDTVPIELLIEAFQGIVYRYDRVHIREQDEHARMNFEFSFIELNGFDEEKLRANKTFNHTLGLILNAMILEYVDSAEPTSGNGNPQEPTKVR